MPVTAFGRWLTAVTGQLTCEILPVLLNHLIKGLIEIGKRCQRNYNLAGLAGIGQLLSEIFLSPTLFHDLV